MAISAFNNGIKIIHLEAGLRSGDLYDPFPEEMNRQVISRITHIHFCPTEYNKENLLKEGILKNIFVVGNTGLDNISKDNCVYDDNILITLHRRDNHEIMSEWFQTIEKIANKYPDINFIIPLHPNPNVSKHKHIFKKVNIIEPLTHQNLIQFVKKCKFVISDSGGLQEECSFLNKKIIVCRRTTERPETIGKNSILCEWPGKLEQIFENINKNYKINEHCPYGDGESWKKIQNIIEYLNK